MILMKNLGIIKRKSDESPITNVAIPKKNITMMEGMAAISKTMIYTPELSISDKGRQHIKIMRKQGRTSFRTFLRKSKKKATIIYVTTFAITVRKP